MTSATNRSRSVPCRSNGRSTSLSSCPSSSCWQHGTARITRAPPRTARSSAASVAVSQAWRLTTRSTSSRSASAMSPTSNERPVGVEASCERLAIGHDVRLDVEPEELDLASVAADEEVVEREREVGASRPEVDDRASVPPEAAERCPRRARRTGSTCRNFARRCERTRPSGVWTPSSTRNGTGSPSGSRWRFRRSCDARPPWPRRRPPQDARRAARRRASASRRRAPGGAPGGSARRSPREGRRRAAGRRGSRPSSGARSGDARASEPPGGRSPARR